MPEESAEGTDNDRMDALTLIGKIQEFLEKECYDSLIERIRKGEKSLHVEFAKLAQFDPALGDYLLDHPDDFLKGAEHAVEQMSVGAKVKGFVLRFNGLPPSSSILVRHVRSQHLNKMLLFDGVVRNKSEVRPQMTAAKFECPSCGNNHVILQIDNKFQEPTRCSCGRKGKFRLVSKELVDAQMMVLEEVPEQLEGGEQPKRMNVLLRNDLVSPLTEKKTNPGARVKVTGQVKEVPIFLKTGGQSTKFDLFIDGNNLLGVDQDFDEINIAPDELKQIKDLAKDPQLMRKIVNSMAPSIYGHEKTKEALALQLAGGVRKKRDDGIITRGDIHILLVGDPGAAKSQLLKRMQHVAPKARYTTGKGASGAGLSAAVVKDEFLQGWSLEAGALVLANRGLLCTAGDSRFILEDGSHMTFSELFHKIKEDVIYPPFRVLGVDTNTLKVKAFPIKRAIRLKNERKVIQVKTRTGRELKLTDENEILTVQGSEVVWKPIGECKKGDFIGVPKIIPIEESIPVDEDFAYIAGLIATDGHIKIDSRHATTTFYNTDLELMRLFKEKMSGLGFTYSSTVQKGGRKTVIAGKEVTSKKDCYRIYNSRKAFAQSLIDFGIPSGDKSAKYALDRDIASYSKESLCSFMRGVFDGDGSIRLNPNEIVITTGMHENAKLFQTILLRLGIISSVEKSTRSWHCSVRGTTNCISWWKLIGSAHPEKREIFAKMSGSELKDRIDILPNHQNFFRQLKENKRGRLGADVFKYIWNYSREGVSPPMHKLHELNGLVKNDYLQKHIEGDILWDKIDSLEEVEEKVVYDFTMSGTDNFIANNIIMHNCIDEMDKMSKEDGWAMHEALEQQQVTISKANIQASLRCETTVLAAANPKFGRFDPFDTVANQINLAPTLLNRFDLIFPVKDIPDAAKDDKMASFILRMHKEDAQKPEIDTKLLRKYFAFGRQNCFPKLTDTAIEELKEYYIKMRASASGDGIKAVPISARQLEGLVRLSEASARLRLSDKVTRKDAQKAVELLDYCLRQIALDEKTGQIDVDRAFGGIPASTRNKAVTIKEILKDLEGKFGKRIPAEDVIAAALERDITEEEAEGILQKLKRDGDIFEPSNGFYSRM